MDNLKLNMVLILLDSFPAGKFTSGLPGLEVFRENVLCISVQVILFNTISCELLYYPEQYVEQPMSDLCSVQGESDQNMNRLLFLHPLDSQPHLDQTTVCTHRLLVMRLLWL